jgi:hypothetical protein
MLKKIRMLAVMFVSVAMLAGTVSTSAYAVSVKSAKQSHTDLLTASLKSTVKNPLSASALKTTNDHPTIKLAVLKNAQTKNLSAQNQTSAPITAMADTSSTTTTTDTPTVYNVSASYFWNTTSLTSSNSQNYYTFSVGSDRYMALGLSSTNTNYYLQLYQYQTTSGNYAATNCIFAATNTVALNDLPAGNYLLAVFSTGTVGDNYTIAMNASNPSNPTNIYNASFLNMVCGYTGSLYANGTAIFTGDSENGTSLDWSYNYDNIYGNYDHGIDQYIAEVKIDTSREIDKPAPYKTAYKSSDSALLIPIKGGVGGTMYVFQDSLLENGTIISHVGPLQLTLNYDDYLVYDLATNKVIDLKGNDNALYGGVRVTTNMLQAVKTNLQKILEDATYCKSDAISDQDRSAVQSEIELVKQLELQTGQRNTEYRI